MEFDVFVTFANVLALFTVHEQNDVHEMKYPLPRPLILNGFISLLKTT